MLPAPSDLDRWRRDLYAACGRPNPHVSFLEPVWHGEPEVCRVVLYQVAPPWATSPLFWTEAQEARVTRLRGYLAPDPRYKVDVNPDALTWRQWQLYERFGGIGQPYWIVEGTRGGHLRRFSDLEQRLLRATGLPDTPPVIGSQPYAPVDQRVIRAVAQRDTMRLWAKAKALYERSPDDFDRDDRDALARGEQALTRWLTDQVAEAFDDVLTYRKTVRDVFAPA
jgi:hypothetical protein